MEETVAKKFVPEDDRALKKLVRETAKAAGADDRAAPSSRVRQRLADQARGDLGVDDYVKRQRRETKKP